MDKTKKETRKRAEGGDGDTNKVPKKATEAKESGEQALKPRKEKAAVENGSTGKDKMGAKNKDKDVEKLAKKAAKVEAEQAPGGSNSNKAAPVPKKNVKSNDDKKEVAAKKAKAGTEKKKSDDEFQMSDSEELPVPTEAAKATKPKALAKTNVATDKSTEEKGTAQKAAGPSGTATKKIQKNSKPKLETAVNAESSKLTADAKAEVPKGNSSTPSQEPTSGDGEKKTAKVSSKKAKALPKAKSGSSSDEGIDKQPAKNTVATNGTKRKSSHTASESDSDSAATLHIDDDNNSPASPEAPGKEVGKAKTRRSKSGSPPPAKKDKVKVPEREVKNDSAAPAKSKAGVSKTKKALPGSTEAAKGPKDLARKSYGLRSKSAATGGAKIKYGP